jgi:arsenite-transporting ATPase
MRLVDILSGQYGNLMIVGDPDQNIYEWRGSDVKLLVDFDKEHEPTKTIILNQNYRSTPQILQCANTLIEKNTLRLKKDLFTRNPSGAPVIHYHSRNDLEEMDQVIANIQKLRETEGLKYSDFAIIYRSGFLSRIAEKKLVEKNIPYEIFGGVRFYQRMEMLVFPGLEELFSMFRILDMYESGEYDTLVVDCAPTGETLALLKYPERLSGLIRRVLPIEKAGVKTVGVLVENLMKLPMPKDAVFDDIEYLMEKMLRLQKLLLNQDIVSLRVVTTPEKIVISEAKRNFTCLYLYHYNVDAVIVNHIYPQEAMEGYFNKWKKLQEEGLREIRESFSEVPRIYVELLSKELRTLRVLEEVADLMFLDCDPNDVLFRKEIYEVDEKEGSLKIYLPFAEKEELGLEQDGKELVVGVKNESRRFPVPAGFAGREIAGAKWENGYLKILFGETLTCG